jgi:agarase
LRQVKTQYGIVAEAAAMTGGAATGEEVRRTRWGGVADGHFAPSGAFRVAQQRDVWWLVDPDGGRFLSKGVNHVRYDADTIRGTTRMPYAEACQRRYGDAGAWRRAAADRLQGWGFNTVGAWSDDRLSHAGAAPLARTVIADLGASFHRHRPQQPFPDVFDAGFAGHARDQAEQVCALHRGDPALLGYFLDNELIWSPDWRGGDDVLTLFLRLPPHSAGRRAAQALLQQHYRDIDAFNAVWRLSAGSWEQLAGRPVVPAPYARLQPGGLDDELERRCDDQDPHRAAFSADCDAFLALVAERYFETGAAALRAADPGHLVLGARFGYQPKAPVIAACARHCDVISFNCYEFDPSGIIAAFAAFGRPCLITEFAFRGDDAGLPNSRGGGPRVAAQQDRARCFADYVRAALRQPALVGCHWFEHADEPREGRFDGEDSNYGLVDLADRPYAPLVAAAAAVHASAEALHAGAVSG